MSTSLQNKLGFYSSMLFHMVNVTLYHERSEINRTACNLGFTEHKQKLENWSVSSLGSWSLPFKIWPLLSSLHFSEIFFKQNPGFANQEVCWKVCRQIIFCYETVVFFQLSLSTSTHFSLNSLKAFCFFLSSFRISLK